MLLKENNRVTDWNDLYYFALIADFGSYSKAAAKAGVSKSVLSRRIANLERRLNVSLIHRTTRRLALTPIGEQFAQECRRMVDQSERAHAIVQAEQAQPRGLLRISAPVFMAETWLSEFVSQFLARWPETRVRLLAINRQVDLISEGIDIALTARVEEIKDSSLHCRKIISQSDVLVASPDWWQTHRYSVSKIEDLANAAAAVRQGESAFWQLVNGDEEVELPVMPRLFSNNLRVLMQAAQAGNGLALLPLSACQKSIDRGDLVQLFPQWKSRPKHVYALFPARDGMSTLARTFLDELIETLSALGLA